MSGVRVITGAWIIIKEHFSVLGEVANVPPPVSFNELLLALVLLTAQSSQNSTETLLQ